MSSASPTSAEHDAAAQRGPAVPAEVAHHAGDDRADAEHRRHRAEHGDPRRASAARRPTRASPRPAARATPGSPAAARPPASPPTPSTNASTRSPPGTIRPTGSCAPLLASMIDFSSTDTPSPSPMPASEATEPTSSGLDQHRADDLPAPRAERGHQRQLTGALRDQDRERVEDQEDADQQRQPGEAEQHDLARCRGTPCRPPRSASASSRRSAPGSRARPRRRSGRAAAPVSRRRPR